MTAIGDKIQIKNGLVGVVRYVGAIEDKEGLWVGLELDKGKGKNNGTIKGKTYFNCKENHGIFVRYEMLKDIIFSEALEETVDRVDSSFKDNSLLFKDCIIKVDDIKKENNNLDINPKAIIKENFQLSKLNEYSKEICKLKKIIKDKENEMKERENKHHQELESLKKLLEKESLKSQELSKSFNKNKADFIKTINGFSKETRTILSQLKEIVKEIEFDSIQPTSEEYKKHTTICKTFRDMLYSFIDEDKIQLDKNMKTLNTLL